MAHETPPLGTLRYLYVGTADFERDLAWYRAALGGQKLWHFRRFGAEVAALRLGQGPLVLLADHRPAPSCMPIFEVDDVEATVRALRARGFQSAGDGFEVPDGPCYRLSDSSGNPFAILQVTRPGAMEDAFRDQANPSAVRD